VGEEVADVLTQHGTERAYTFTAPSTGTVDVRVNWDGTCGGLELWFGNVFAARAPGSIEAKLPVVAGQQYRVRVADAAAWDYDELWLPFVLTTSIR
jgi:hypothetical protein